MDYEILLYLEERSCIWILVALIERLVALQSPSIGYGTYKLLTYSLSVSLVKTTRVKFFMDLYLAKN